MTIASIEIGGVLLVMQIAAIGPHEVSGDALESVSEVLFEGFWQRLVSDHWNRR